MKKLLIGLPALLAILLPLALGHGDDARAATNITVRAGDGEAGYSVDLFLPDTVYILPGDTVTWTFPWFEPHTVTFGQPTGDPTVPTGGSTYDGTGFVSSGLVFSNPASPSTYALTFPNAGSYDYFCVIHPFMTGTVEVLPPNVGQPDTQLSVDTRGDANYSSALTELKLLAASFSAKPLAVTNRAGGGKKYTVELGPATTRGTVMQYFPPSVSLKANDSVEWVTTTPVPHTVTLNPQLYPGGDPFEAPADASGLSFDGSKLLNSGILGTDPSYVGTKWEVVFTKAGTYNYVCLLHAPQGMAGTVKVDTTTAAPAPPSTGIAYAGDGESGLWLILGALGAISAIAGTTVLAVRREV